jgi:LacI family transcriptional regulator
MSMPPHEPTAPPPTHSRATLRTISELTGLSQSTVSLSLRGGTSLKEETHRKVAEAAAKVGYVPNRAGVRLRTGKTNVIVLVLDGADDSIDFARQMIQGIGAAMRDTRYHLTVTPVFDRESVEAVRYIVANQTADGVIITHTSARDRRVQFLMDNNFPFVTHGRTEFFSPHAFHDFHSEEFVRLAMERMVEQGCRRVTYVIGGDRTYNYHNIVTAFERNGARLRVDTQVVRRMTDRAASAELRQLGRDIARGEQRPDGVICDSETRSICIIAGLIDEGVVLDRDLHFICKQTSDLLSTLYPAVDTIEEDVFAAGGELTRLLVRRIKGEPPESLQTLSEPKAHWHD